MEHDPSSARPMFRVPDTLEALNALARAARLRTNARIAAVTGSAGKTGTKEMLRVMLGKSGRTHASEKSYNNLWGVPLSLARMPASARFGVFEIGMNHPGEITPLTRLVRPHLAIVTCIAPVHIEFFNSLADIADAKAEIFEGLEQGGAAILPQGNEQFERLAAHARRHGATVIPFGEQAEGGAQLLHLEPGERSKVMASILGSKLAFTLGVPGRHLALNAIAALAAVKLMGGDLEAASRSAGLVRSAGGPGRTRAVRNAGRSGFDYRRDLQRQPRLDGRGAGRARRDPEGSIPPPHRRARRHVGAWQRRPAISRRTKKRH